MSQIQITAKLELIPFFEQIPSDISRGILFSGDRFACIDEGVVIKEDEIFIGVATIAPKGEAMSGKPTIVGFYIMPEYQRKGYGLQLMQATVERCIERNLTPVFIEAMTERITKICQKLPQNLQAQIDLEKLYTTFPFILEM